MSPYVKFQKHIIRILFRLQENQPEYLYKLAAECKCWQTTLPADHRNYLISEGLRLSVYGVDQHDIERVCLEIIKSQLEVDGNKVQIKNLLGDPLPEQGSEELEELLKRGGNYLNNLRTTLAAQPSTLRIGDILITGERIMSPPREGGNGSVLLHLSGGAHGDWISVPARIPIALSSPV